MNFYLDCNRSGNLEGRWVCTQEKWKKFLKDHEGKEICLHDILGKHSEVTIKINELDETKEGSCVSILTDNQDFLNMAKKLKINLSSGFNPFDYVDEL
jgi:hypothetical protein